MQDAGAAKPVRVAAIYHIWPHYRQAVMEAMDRLPDIEFTFLGDTRPYDGIEIAPPDCVRRFRPAPFGRFRSLVWQPKAVAMAVDRQYDAVMYLAVPHFLSTWAGALIARLTGKKVLFWSHGWIKDENGISATARLLFHRLAHHVLVYAPRGREKGMAAGYPGDRLTVVYNSLDVAAADRIVAEIEDGSLADRDPRKLFAHPERPLLICTGRLTAKVRLDLLFDAAAQLAAQGRPVNIILVGDGPERPVLEAQAARLGQAVHFLGACYDEVVVGQLIHASDIMVAPGKIGLTAMHSMMYGTPAITHDNFDDQMPECEAIEDGVTGTFFRQGDADDLAAAIARWLDTSPDRDAVRAATRRVIREKWNPQTQARNIGHVIGALFPRSAPPQSLPQDLPQ